MSPYCLGRKILRDEPIVKGCCIKNLKKGKKKMSGYF